MKESKKTIVLDGNSLTCALLYTIGYNDNIKVMVSEEAQKRVQEARKIVDDVIKNNEIKYGITTGFGNFASVSISQDKVEQLQVNLIRSHAVGVGDPLPIERARMLLALRINVLAKGYSGIRWETIDKLVKALNANCIPLIPEKGTVGASGDLAPLSHMALGLMGEGKMWNPTTKKFEDAAKVLKEHNLEPIQLKAKEGLSLINGTQFICAIGSEAIYRAANIAKSADVVAAMTLEALRGSFKAYDARVHLARPHSGQIAVAKRMRELLLTKDGKPSEISESHKDCNRVQDSYTLRCIPQVHGIVNDTIEFCQKILHTELNSATDNPMVFTNTSGSEIKGLTENIISAGNFHGQYPAKALDYLAVGVADLGTISERRIARLIDGNLSELPSFLVKEGGLNSGFMIAHCTAAALASENKVLCHPSSCDTIPTSANKEDHVSMGGYAARKALQVVDNVETILAIELLCACQGLNFLRPLKTSPQLEAVWSLVRSKVPEYKQDRYMKPDIDAVKELLSSGKIWSTVSSYMTQ